MDELVKTSYTHIAPSKALELLKEGNNRFVTGNMMKREINKQAVQLSRTHSPFAVVLGCMDFRVPTELIFDQQFGEFFNLQVVGNFVNPSVIGSIEYSCKIAGAKLVVVLGDEDCWAVKAACDGVEIGNITELLSNLKDVVSSVDELGDRTSSNPEFVSKVVGRNVEFAVDDIKADSPILMEMEQNAEIMIVGAVYNSKSGKVTFR